MWSLCGYYLQEDRRHLILLDTALLEAEEIFHIHQNTVTSIMNQSDFFLMHFLLTKSLLTNNTHTMYNECIVTMNQFSGPQGIFTS